MGNENRRNDDAVTRDGERHADPANAATDPHAAAQQAQVKADHDALEESARRVESSVEGRNATFAGEAATDPAAARKQDQVKADHDALAASARRVESSVSADVRDTPVQHTDLRSGAGTTGDADDARRNADIARDSARRVDASVDEEPRDRR